jgi:hypothetical protein
MDINCPVAIGERPQIPDMTITAYPDRRPLWNLAVVRRVEPLVEPACIAPHIGMSRTGHLEVTVLAKGARSLGKMDGLFLRVRHEGALCFGKGKQQQRSAGDTINIARSKNRLFFCRHVGIYLPRPPVAARHRRQRKFNEIVMCALTKDPEKRYATAVAMANDLLAVRASLDASGSSPGLSCISVPLALIRSHP